MLIYFVLSFAMVCTLLAGINVVAFAADDDDLVVGVHSFYNDVTKGGDGEHLYTKDQEEMSYLSLLGTWNDEDVAWNAPVSSSTAIWRCYNPNSGEHLYVPEGYADYLAGEHWNKEKVSFYSDDNEGTPVYRLWNGLDAVGSHYFTTSYEYALWLADTYGWQIEDIAFYGVKEEEPEEFEITAMQTGANKVTVVSTMELSVLDDITLMRGENEQDIDVELSDDGKTATLTTTNDIADDDYTVIVTPADETIMPAMDMFEGEEAEIAQIAFVSDKFVLMANPATDKVDGSAGFAAIRGFNQFGEMVILDDLEKSIVSPVDGDASVVDYDEETGVIASMFNEENTYVIGNPVSVTAVYQDGTNVKQASAVLTVSAARNVAEISFGEVSTTSATLIGQRITHEGLKSNTYYIPVTAKDQYGVDLTASDLQGMLAGGTLIVSPDHAAAAKAYAAVTGFQELDDGTVAMMLEDGGVTYPGTQPITVLSVGGAQGATSVTIEDARYFDSLTVSFPTLYVDEPAELTISAVDQYGVEFTDEDLYKMATPAVSDDGNTVTFKDVNGLTKSNSSIEDMGGYGTFAVSKNPSTKKLKITYTPGANAQAAGKAYNETFIVSSATPTVSTQNEKVNPAGTPKGIKGLADGVNTVLGGINNKVKLSDPKNIVFTDTYGKVCDNGDVVFNDDTADYYYTVTPPTGGGKYTELDNTDNTIVAKENAGSGSDKWTITLYDGATDKALDKRDITVSVSTGEYVGFQAGFMNATTKTPKANLYTGVGVVAQTPYADDKAGIAVYAVDTNGNKVRLAATDVATATTGSYLAVLTNTDVKGATLGLDTASAPGECALYVRTTDGPQDVDTPLNEDTASVDIYFVGEDGLTLIDSIDIECSNATPEQIMIAGVTGLADNNVAFYDLSKGITVNNGSQFTVDPDSHIITVRDVNAGFVSIASMDQYGRVLPVDYATYNGEEVTNGMAVGNGGSLVLAADDISTRVAITLK